MDGPVLKRKVTVKFNSSTPSRPPSPVKSPTNTSNFRPKAKVNSSATTRKTTSATTSSIGSSSKLGLSAVDSNGASASSTPRAGSPAKLTPRLKNGTLPSTTQPKAKPSVRSALRPQTSASAPGTPDLRSRALTTSSPSDAIRYNDSRARNGSVSLHHAVSFSSLHPVNIAAAGSPRLQPLDLAALSDHEGRCSPSMRVKSKVSGMALSKHADSPSPSPLTPLFPSTRPTHVRSRAPSVSTNISQSSVSPVFFPITTATAAANPYRFVTTRHSPASSYAQSYSPHRDEIVIIPSRPNGMARVDPASIPLPPHSPPVSSLSFSSRSSVSHAPNSEDSQVNSLSNQTVDPLRTNLEKLVQYSAMRSSDGNYSGDSGQDRETDGEIDDQERKIKAEAKSNRKIADLEITNRSLLAINASLETTRNRQAKEIRELRRKLRESRLILPPKTFQAVSLDDVEAVDDEEDEASGDEDEEATDETYKRIKVMLEGLLESGRRALDTKKEDFSSGKGAAKVLTADEVRTWRDSSGKHSFYNGFDGIGHLVDPFAHGNGPGFDSEDEVEAMTLPRGSAPPSPVPPPILITEPDSLY